MVHITKSIVASVGIVWLTSVVATVFDSYKTPNTIYTIEIWLEFVIFSNCFLFACLCVFSLSPCAYIAVYCCVLVIIGWDLTACLDCSRFRCRRYCVVLTKLVKYILSYHLSVLLLIFLHCYQFEKARHVSDFVGFYSKQFSWAALNDLYTKFLHVFNKTDFNIIYPWFVYSNGSVCRCCHTVR